MTTAALAVSMGDPAGVGLEIAARTWVERSRDTPPFFLIADIDATRRAAARAGITLRADAIAAPESAAALFADALPVLHAPLPEAETPGSSSVVNAPAIVAAIERGVALARSGKAAAIVTLPIAKATLYAAGFRHPGHTEFVARLSADMPYDGPRGPVMMLAAPGLRVSLVTIHTPLANVPTLLTAHAVEQTARVTLDALRRDFGIAQPRLALAALNPHAGENGALGREEIEIIDPVAARLRSEGFDVGDARPADTLFHAEARAGYDAVVAMYHDQGLVPIKTLDFWGATNLTLGLPIVRTSPDHGTGFDIAGKGKADARSFIAALDMAAAIARRRAR